MTDLKQHAKAKSTKFTVQVASDPRWRLEDELMCQVFGFTLYGYVFGIGRVHCFLDVEDIHAIVVDQLAGLGIGRKYVEGLVEAAHQEFVTENNQSWQNQLIGVGHSHALQEEMRLLIDSIFSNTAEIRKAMAQRRHSRRHSRRQNCRSSTTLVEILESINVLADVAHEAEGRDVWRYQSHCIEPQRLCALSVLFHQCPQCP